MFKHHLVIIQFTLVLFLSAPTIGQAQLDRNTWIVGGTASLSSTRINTPIAEDEKETKLVLRPDVGYFILDKFAAGIRTGYSRTIWRNEEAANKVKEIPLGVFGRYYFLRTDQSYNLLLDVGFNHTMRYVGGTFNEPIDEIELAKTSHNGFSLAAGPVIFFNSSVGMQFLVEYISMINKDFETKEHLLQFSIGLQVHLTPFDKY